MKIEYHPSTVSDLQNAVAYYESLRPGLGSECAAQIYGAIQRILEAPHRYRIVDNGIRRAFVHRFPFSILFRKMDGRRVRILVIRHHRQAPDFGRERR